MKHLPLFFDLAGRKVVVVGSGPMAERRAALQAALAEIDAKFGKGAIKKGDEIEAD
mgnify:CR=1 FL=1